MTFIFNVSLRRTANLCVASTRTRSQSFPRAVVFPANSGVRGRVPVSLGESEAAQTAFHDKLQAVLLTEVLRENEWTAKRSFALHAHEPL
jgi:hypothetical protein